MTEVCGTQQENEPEPEEEEEPLLARNLRFFWGLGDLSLTLRSDL